MVLQDLVTNENRYFSTTIVPMATKLGMVTIYLDKLLFKSYMTL